MNDTITEVSMTEASKGVTLDSQPYPKHHDHALNNNKVTNI